MPPSPPTPHLTSDISFFLTFSACVGSSTRECGRLRGPGCSGDEAAAGTANYAVGNPPCSPKKKRKKERKKRKRLPACRRSYLGPEDVDVSVFFLGRCLQYLNGDVLIQSASHRFFPGGKNVTRLGNQQRWVLLQHTTCAALELFAISAAAATSCQRAELPLRAAAAAAAASSRDVISPRSETAQTLRCVLTARAALDAAATALPWRPGGGEARGSGPDCIARGKEAEANQRACI